MAYGRRNFIAYHRGGVVGASGTVTAPSRSLASYRNKIVAILAVTVVYTAFLYKSGRAVSLFFTRERESERKTLAGLVGCICRVAGILLLLLVVFVYADMKIYPFLFFFFLLLKMR